LSLNTVWRGRVVSDLSVADVGNYSCRIGGPQNTFVASVTHQLSVRGKMIYTCITIALAVDSSVCNPAHLLERCQ